jgi:histidyl-tRNA synthetase
VELDASGAAFGKQFKRADRSGAAWAVVLGDGELEQGVVRLKPLRDGSAAEQVVPLEAAAVCRFLTREDQGMCTLAP